MNRLKGKVAIITAADGLRLAISQAFVNEGALIVMCERNNDCSDSSK